MKKLTIVILVILVIAGVLGVVYFKYEPKDKKEYSNVSIATLYNNKLIKTQVDINGELINTSTSYERIVLEKGQVVIKNFNLKDQDFYEETFIYNVTDNNTRIDITLEKPKYPKIEIDYEDNKLILELYDGNFKEVKVCLKGSTNYLFLDTEGLEEIKKLEGFENYDSCFDTGFSVIETQKINVTYTELSNPTDFDFINISLIDYSGNFITKKIK